METKLKELQKALEDQEKLISEGQPQIEELGKDEQEKEKLIDQLGVRRANAERKVKAVGQDDKDVEELEKEKKSLEEQLKGADGMLTIAQNFASGSK